MESGQVPALEVSTSICSSFCCSREKPLGPDNCNGRDAQGLMDHQDNHSFAMLSVAAM
jgi:hypothetical protein